MTDKTIDISENVYKKLMDLKSENESISNLILRLINEDKTYYIDGFAFPGNSGSPVFFKPRGFWLTNKGMSMGKHPLGGKFVGMIGGYLPFTDRAVSVQTGKTRVLFEENAGLSIVWSIDYLCEIIESDSFRTQLKSLVESFKKRELEKVNKTN